MNILISPDQDATEENKDDPLVINQPKYIEVKILTWQTGIKSRAPAAAASLTPTPSNTELVLDPVTLNWCWTQ